MNGFENFEEIYNVYFKDVYRYLLALTRSENLAEELTAETFFKALRAAEGFRGCCDVRVWLCQIAKNEYLMHLRKNKRTASTEPLPDEDSPAYEPSAPVNVEQQAVDADTAVRIHKLLHTMPEPYKEVFQLRVFGELSFAQIGDVFDRTANWACVTFHRARAMIQKEMEDKS